MERVIRVVIAVLLSANLGMLYILYNVRTVEKYEVIVEAAAENRHDNIILKDDSETINNFLCRLSLAEEVLDGYPLATSDAVIDLWARGIIEKNGVMQYTAMSREMKNKFKEYLKKTNNTSWVTGNNESGIADYEIIDKNIISNRIIIYKLKFAGRDAEYNGDFTVVFDGNRWAMTQITMFET